MYRNKCFQIINKAIGNHLTEADELEIENRTKIWYGTNYHPFLDSAISIYHGESTVIEQICASIRGHQWSIVYVKIVSDKSLDKMDMCKEQYFCLR